ncbi:TniQ family protein [Streptomyces spongiae]|uniref:hypothetical protein n=1 Tax=Streptomyces spongiae TaxID=565072 RepID=UPI0018844A14|nr:hypothetical protein [Streptomyces spongiae]
MTGSSAERLAELPVNVRPRLGESTDSYVRRLARANHLKPSDLHCLLVGPPNWFGKPRIERLAAVSGRSETALQRALSDASSARGRAKPTPRTLRIHAHKALKQGSRDMTLPIQYDALGGGTSVRQIAQRWNVPRWLVRRVLDSAVFPDRQTPRNRYVMTGPVKEQINSMIVSGMGPKEIWTELMDVHDISVSMGSLQRQTSHRHPATRRPR